MQNIINRKYLSHKNTTIALQLVHRYESVVRFQKFHHWLQVVVPANGGMLCMRERSLGGEGGAAIWSSTSTLIGICTLDHATI